MTAEVLILVINALGAGLLLFVAGVIQNVMNGMQPAAFKDFLNALGRSAMTNSFAVTIATLPMIAAIAYFVAFGFGHWWFTSGFILWLIGSSVTKVVNLPIYRWVGDPKNADAEQLVRLRRKLGFANNLRAGITFMSVAAMACEFGTLEVLAVTLASLLLVLPLLWLGRRYLPN